MAVPTIASVAPAVGITGGGNIVEVLGTGFRLWQIPPPSNGPSAGIRPTVEVLFGGVPGTRVAVVSATRLFVIAPKSPLPVVKPDFGEGSVDVTVRNLDDDEEPIAGETATLVDAYAYQRVQLALESDLVRVSRALLREFKLQVLANTSYTTHTDYDPESEDLAGDLGLAELPGLALLGPEMTQNRFYSTNQRVSTSASAGERVIRRVPYTVDLAYAIVGVSQLKKESLNLMAVCQGFFEANKYLEILRDDADPSLGSVRHPIKLQVDGDMKADPTASRSSVRVFSGRFVVVGFNFEDLAGLPGSQVVGRTAQVTENPDVGVVQFVPPEED